MERADCAFRSGLVPRSVAWLGGRRGHDHALLIQSASDIRLELIEGTQMRSKRLQVSKGSLSIASLSIEEVEQALAAAAVCVLDGVAGQGRAEARRSSDRARR